MRIMRCSAVVFLTVLATQFAGTGAFIAPKHSIKRVTSTLQVIPDIEHIKDIAYGEESRKYRRTVYSHDDWRKHRSSDRFIRNLSSMFVSGVYKNLGREVAATTGVAAFICLYNAFVGGYTDFEGQQQAALISSFWLPMIGLPLAPFFLMSPSLGLLLGMLKCRQSILRSLSAPHAHSFPLTCSFPHQHFIPALGRSTKELGNEHQPHSRSGPHGQCFL